mgnify:FL=1
MTLFTIGYEGLDERQFMAHLSHHAVDVVADVRKLPVSRKKGFSKTALGEMLKQRKISYRNFQKLGAPKDIREELYRSGDYRSFFLRYRDSIADKQGYLKEILTLIHSGRNVTLLCFERDPEKCHRKVVAEELMKIDGNGLKVSHIVPI